MTLPIVTEIPLRLEAVTTDSFIDGVQVEARPPQRPGDCPPGESR